jgi:hypothetical protein
MEAFEKTHGVKVSISVVLSVKSKEGWTKKMTYDQIGRCPICGRPITKEAK